VAKPANHSDIKCQEL